MTLVEAPAGDTVGLELVPGTIIKCITCYKKEICGEMVAIDLNKKSIIVGKSESDV